MHLRTLGFVAFVFLLAPSPAPAGDALPYSFNAKTAPLSTVQVVDLPKLDLKTIATEDALREASGQPPRFAMPEHMALDTRTAGTWQTVDDHRSIWRLRFQTDNAVSVNFGFTHYRLPPSARLFIYSRDHQHLAGPWGMKKNEPHGQLWTPVIVADEVIIELDVATAERDQVELLLTRVNQGYRSFGGISKGYAQPDVGEPKVGKTSCSGKDMLSGSCNMDVACLAPSDPWNEPRRAVAAITVNGIDTCTGSLINNTANDRRRLFVTASHCGLSPGNEASVVLYWNYEWPTCRTPGSSASGQSNPPDPQMSSSGTNFLAATPSPFDSGCNSSNTHQCTDWTIVEVTDPFDDSWDLYWEGWDRRSVGAVCSEPADPTSTAGLCASIHQPNVDEKRITFVLVPLTLSGIAGGSNTHWRAAWDPTPPVLPGIGNPPSSLPPGVTEPGSSGSPLFSADQRIVGVLSGGNSFCGATGTNLSDKYGQLALAWEGSGSASTRMKDYLDPLGTAPQYIDGIAMSPFILGLNPASLEVCTADNSSATTQVELTSSGGFSGSVALAATGQPAGSTVSFAPVNVPVPGSSTMTLNNLDLVAVGQHQLTVSGISGSDSTQRTLSLRVNHALPGTTSPVSPADGAIDVPQAALLSWSDAGGTATDYHVEIATDAAFGNVVFSRTVSDVTSVIINPVLSPSTTYYWRVRAGNACGQTSYSAARSFTTGVQFPLPYCSVDFSYAVEPITRVMFSGIDNHSPAAVDGSPAHEDFLAVPGGDIEAGQSYVLLVEGNTAGGYSTPVKAYFDWDRNGNFEASEGHSIGTLTNSSGTDGQNVSATITVPPGMTEGNVRMRVIKKYSSEAGPCNTVGWGQAEDYRLKVISDTIFQDGFEPQEPGR